MADFEEEEATVGGEEEVSDAEKRQIFQHLLLSAPPGEFGEVLRDAKRVCRAKSN